MDGTLLTVMPGSRYDDVVIYHIIALGKYLPGMKGGGGCVFIVSLREVFTLLVRLPSRTFKFRPPLFQVQRCEALSLWSGWLFLHQHRDCRRDGKRGNGRFVYGKCSRN